MNEADLDNQCAFDSAGNGIRKPAPACVLVVFGVAGDLMKRLLYPAICNIGSEGMLNKNFCIVGIARHPNTDEEFRKQLTEDVNNFITDPKVKEFALHLIQRVYFIRGNFDDPKLYTDLKNKLEDLQKQVQASKNCLFYFACPPQFMSIIASELGKADLLVETDSTYFRRLVVEKPFGHDLPSAIQLNKDLLAVATEKQIFRIDHFLGKETVQNILAFRFSNGLFEPMWNRLYIDNIQISVAEELGIETRGSYYESVGALRDMVPNHLFQMLSLITMEPPISFSADNIQDEKEKALRSVERLTPEQVFERVVRGQYGPGSIDPQEVLAYRSEKAVAPDSNVETYVALKLFLDNWRWLHVPIYLRTGKRLKARTSEIIVEFKSGPSALFTGCEHKVTPNLLRIYIQPDEGISLQFNAKKPGPSLQLGQVDMKFKYSDYFGIKPQTGYETILYDCMNGDHLLFKKAEMVETEWALVQPILDVWAVVPPKNFPNYPSGSWGPEAADELIKKDGREWLL